MGAWFCTCHYMPNIPGPFQVTDGNKIAEAWLSSEKLNGSYWQFNTDEKIKVIYWRVVYEPLQNCVLKHHVTICPGSPPVIDVSHKRKID